MDQPQQHTVQTFERIPLFLEQEKVKPGPPLLTQKQAKLAESVARLQQAAPMPFYWNRIREPA